MKYTLATVFCLSLVFALTGCQSNQKAESDSTADQSTEMESGSSAQSSPVDADQRFLDSLSYRQQSTEPIEAPETEKSEANKDDKESSGFFDGFFGLFEKEKSQKMLTSADIRDTVNGELDSLAHSEEELKNRGWRTVDTNWRAASDDWHRLWLMDRPSRSTVYPVP